ncbi:hypothetical protein NDU88_000514 [Pleurodeles waltl]|uniref:Uncharacterized protein n=1 Tax=Pleurodeles waltl TaxID=8319 RepID=A0AAV7P8H3_PLEWA|nr:hypothetical protein NDU88_000514 [Pleurodeles waltl]
MSAVGCRLEGMDNAMASLTAEMTSIHIDITGFQSRIASSQDWYQELLYPSSKMIDLEDRSRRDNVRFLGFSETIEGVDIHSFLPETLPKLTGITFDPPLKFQRAHRLGPKRRDAATQPDRS